MLGRRRQPRRRTNCVPGGLCCQPVAAASKEPRVIGSVEGFAWADDTCRALADGRCSRRAGAGFLWVTGVSNDGGPGLEPTTCGRCGSRVDRSQGDELGHLAQSLIRTELTSRDSPRRRHREVMGRSPSCR
jgi:hypothetical protein